MTSSTASSSGFALANRAISHGNTVLVKFANGEIRGIKTEKDSNVVLSRLGSLSANELIGQPYGLTYEITKQRTLKVIPPRTLLEVEDTDATNELINDGEFVQPLTGPEIEALKESGVHASDIIQKQIEQHANYSLKTEYSKEKYKKRKEAKYSKSFTTIEPTIFNISEYWFNKDQNRVRDIRPDTLGQLLNLANIRPGGRYIAVDEASGVVVAGILERMGGQGRLITICDIDGPPAYPVLVTMNFEPEITQVMSSLNWASMQEEYIPLKHTADTIPENGKTDRQKSRVNKRKAAADLLINSREELFLGEFDGLIVASIYEPWSIVDKLSPYLAGSSNIVVQSPHVHVLADLHSKMRALPMYLAPSVTEAFLRCYQVLPGRTHPMMSTSGTGGYLLHTIKVYDDPAASSVLRQRHKRPKLEAAPTGTTTPIPATSTSAEASATMANNDDSFKQAAQGDVSRTDGISKDEISQ